MASNNPKVTIEIVREQLGRFLGKDPVNTYGWPPGRSWRPYSKLYSPAKTTVNDGIQHLRQRASVPSKKN